MESHPSSLRDWKLLLVAALCVSGSATGGFLLYQDLTSRGGAGVGAPMARIERLEAQVRRKPASTYVWSSVGANDELWRKDAIQTGPSSGAVIQFKDGSSLEVGESSLVMIEDITDLALSFRSGSIIVRKKDGTDSRITVGKDGKMKTEVLPVRLLAPQPLSQYFVKSRSGPKALKFSWELRGPLAGSEGAAKGDESGIRLQISPDRSFRSERVQTIRLAADASEAEAPLEPGIWFWRVVRGKASASEPRQLRIVAATPLKPLSPAASSGGANGGRVPVWSESTAVQFRWNALIQGVSPGPGVQHAIEVARDEKFKQILQTQPVAAETGLAALTRLPEGELFWRLRSEYPDLSLSSDVERFAIERAKKLDLELGSPSAGASFEVLPALNFTWNANASSEPIEYEWELQTGDGKPVTSTRAGARGFVWNKLSPGPYRWRVSAIWKEQRVGETPWRPFSVYQGRPLALREPRRDQEILYWEKPTVFDLSWDEDALVKGGEVSYQLELSGDPQFQSRTLVHKTRKQEASSSELKLPAGVHYWRVKVVDGAGLTIKASEPRKFVYGVYPPLKAPAQAKPEPGTVYNVVQDERVPVLSWTPVKDAESYEVLVYQGGRAPAGAGSGAAAKVVFKSVTERTTIELSKLSEEGKYYYTIRPVDRLKRTGEALAPQHFTITYGEPLASPDVTTPEVQ